MVKLILALLVWATHFNLVTGTSLSNRLHCKISFYFTSDLYKNSYNFVELQYLCKPHRMVIICMCHRYKSVCVKKYG